MGIQQRLLNVDLYRYDDAWERDATEALSSFFSLKPCKTHDAALLVAAHGLDRLLDGLVAEPNTLILDFRRASDYEALHLPNSVNIPLVALGGGAARGSPFAKAADDCSMLEELWLELEGLFTVEGKDGRRNASAEALMAILRGKRVLTMCYDGESARVANSVLRAKGINSDSIRGGYAALASVRLPHPGCDQESSHVVFVRV